MPPSIHEIKGDVAINKKRCIIIDHRLLPNNDLVLLFPSDNKTNTQKLQYSRWRAKHDDKTWRLGRLGLALDEMQSFLHRNTVNGTRLVVECHTVALVGSVDNLGTESRADELRASFVGDGLEQRGNSCSVLGVKVGVDLVKDNHRAAFSLLEGKDQAESAQTWNYMLVLMTVRAPSKATYSFDHH